MCNDKPNDGADNVDFTRQEVTLILTFYDLDTVPLITVWL